VVRRPRSNPCLRPRPHRRGQQPVTHNATGATARDTTQDGEPGVFLVALFLVHAEDTVRRRHRHRLAACAYYGGAQHPPPPAEEGGGLIQRFQPPCEGGGDASPLSLSKKTRLDAKEQLQYQTSILAKFPWFAGTSTITQ
jgi:hypothetical protein